MDNVEETIENPGLGVVHYAESIQDIVDWIGNFDSAPAVLVTPSLWSRFHDTM